MCRIKNRQNRFAFGNIMTGCTVPALPWSTYIPNTFVFENKWLDVRHLHRLEALAARTATELAGLHIPKHPKYICFWKWMTGSTTPASPWSTCCTNGHRTGRPVHPEARRRRHSHRIEPQTRPGADRRIARRHSVCERVPTGCYSHVASALAFEDAKPAGTLSSSTSFLAIAQR